MKIDVKSKYLVFPVNVQSNMKKMSFIQNGKTVYSLNIKLDVDSPNYYAYVDLSRFEGQTLDLSIVPETKIEFRAADKIDLDGIYKEPLRPRVHFSTQNGWLNDPNGLVYIDGTYHMFYQYNPTEPNWENMHWGHAVSQDMLHWEEKDIALFPDERGTMFSGSAIVDHENILGMNEGANKAAVLFYTATSPYSQHMSFSTDNFKTIKHFEGNPIVANIIGNNRDPKVVFCEEIGCYIMALYLNDDVYCILKSDNLTKWSELQRINLDADNECPDIFPIYDNCGEKKWVFIGAHDRYLVGNFSCGIFTPEQTAQSLHFGDSAYAGQTFSNLPDNRVVRIEWDRWHAPVTTFNGQMGIPMELSLDKADGKYYLCAAPIKEIQSIYKDTQTYANVALSGNEAFKAELNGEALLVKLKGKYPEKASMTMNLFGVDIVFDFENNQMKLGNCVAPISVEGCIFDATVIVDCCSIEIYADGGKIFTSCLDCNTVCDYYKALLTINANNTVVLDNIEIDLLDSIWN